MIATTESLNFIDPDGRLSAKAAHYIEDTYFAVEAEIAGRIKTGADEDMIRTRFFEKLGPVPEPSRALIIKCFEHLSALNQCCVG